MQQDYFKRVQAATPTRFWINNVTRREAELALAAGAVGCTQNPSYVHKMLTAPGEKEYALSLLDGILAKTQDDTEAQVLLQRELVAAIAEKFMPLYAASRGRLGYVSIQGDPIREDADTIVRYARMNREAGPNIMAKIPATPEGLEAIGILLGEGVPVNATEVMCVRQAVDVLDVYDKATKGMANPPVTYYSHIAGIFDEFMKNRNDGENLGIPGDCLYQAGLIVARKIHRLSANRETAVGFISGGARGLHHFTEMVGAAASITINWVGTADKLLEQNPPVVSRFFAPTEPETLDCLLEKSAVFRKAYLQNAILPEEYEDFGPVELFRSMFVNSWNQALEIIAARRK